MSNLIERRFQASSIGLVAGEGDKRTMEGDAAVTGEWSTGCGWFEEMMMRGCFDQVLRSSNLECYSLFNHEPSRVLGVTTNGELRLSVQNANLRQQTDLAGDTIDSQTMISHLKAKRIKRMSFAFRVNKRDHEKWYEDNGVIKREVNVVDELFDVSPVTYAAYAGANVTIRGIVPGQDKAIDDVMRTFIKCERGLSVGATELQSLRDFKDRIESFLVRTSAEAQNATQARVTAEDLRKMFDGLL